MNAVATVIEPESFVEAGGSEPTALERSMQALTDLFGHCERLHRSNIQHDPHSCLVCFERR